MIMLVMATAITASGWSADHVCSPGPKPGCFIQAKRDVVFIIDHSGSIARRGQTYNVEIEGVAKALRDPTVIPRDGSTAVVIVLFDDNAFIKVASDDLPNSKQLKGIDSDEQAIKIAAMVETLRCSVVDDPAAPPPCPSGNTNFGAAIAKASDYLKEHGRQDARRMLFMFTDGQPTDLNGGVTAANEARLFGKVSELDVILIGLDFVEFPESQARVEKIVFPQPTDELPGGILKINAGSCNQPGASLDDPDCVRQVYEFASHIRTLLRSDVLPVELVVNTDEDTSDGDKLSLRQAIEIANCRGGNATITFDKSLIDKTIIPLTPLPALTAPDITIDGVVKCDAESCPPRFVTIDGSRVDVTRGEAHSDGILIRSNHDSVRGLKIINFKRAGVTVEPVCPFDNVGCNRIELNTLEDNAMAGVLILDPVPVEGKLVAHNVGNTISRNAISGSRIPVDLGGDESTLNDSGDADEGPNTLLNFPIIVSMVQTGDTVTIKGEAAAGQVIEVFKINSLKNVSGKSVIDGTAFLTEVIADSMGSFIATDLPVSPTRLYTASATDPFISPLRCSNTSELAPIDIICTLPAISKITLEDGKSSLEFRKKVTVRTFVIENVGCAPLELSVDSIKRTGSGIGGIIDPDKTDDSGMFSVRIINPGGTISDFPKGQSIMILRGSENARRFSVLFHPVIPPVVNRTGKFAASELVPNNFTTAINLTFKNNGEGQRTINLKAKVKTAVRLVNSNGGESEPVVFTRSGDEFAVTFSVYDSDLSVNTVKYKFRDAAKNLISVEPIDSDLAGPIKEHNLIVGQSFTVIQKLPSLRDHPNIVEVEVIVSDGEKEISASAKLMTKTNQALSRQILRRMRSATLILPATEFIAVPEKSRKEKQR